MLTAPEAARAHQNFSVNYNHASKFWGSDSSLYCLQSTADFVSCKQSSALLRFKKVAQEFVMRKFKIPKVPQSTSKSIRFPNEVIEEVEKAIVGTECTFSAFVVEAVRVALENLSEDEEENWKLSNILLDHLNIMQHKCIIWCAELCITYTNLFML